MGLESYEINLFYNFSSLGLTWLYGLKCINVSFKYYVVFYDTIQSDIR